MSISLADVLSLPALAGSGLAPPDADRSVTIAGVVPAGETDPQPGPYLLACAGAPPEKVPTGCAAILARSAGATGTTPVVVLPGGALWSETLGAITEALGARGGLAAAAKARAALRRLATVDATPDDVAATAANLMGAPVALLDEYLNVLGSAELTLAHRAELQTAVESARGHGPVSLAGVFVREGSDGAHRREVIGARDPVGVVVVWLERCLGPEDVAIMNELEFAFLGMRSRDAVRLDTEARLRGDFIEELCAGEPLSPDLVVRRARHLGAELATGAIAVAGTLQDPHNQGRRITDERLVKRFLQRGRSVIAMNRSGALLDWRDGELLILLPPPRAVEEGQEATTDAEALTLGERLMSASAQAVPGLALTLAFSRFTRDPARLGMAIEEARLAHSIAEKLGRVGELVTFEETGSYKLLFRVLADRPDEISAFFGETVKPVLEYDRDHQTDLTATLSTYLENDGNLAATAAQLFTHRHTVRYRLDRIRDVAGLDVGRSEDREMLSLGLKAMRLLGYPPPHSTLTSSVGEEQAAG